MLDIRDDWALDANGDIARVEGSRAAAQRLKIRLGTQKGEWRFDQSIGVSWLYSILSQRGDSTATRQLVVDQIRLDPEVAAIGEIQASFNNAARRLSYTVAVRLIDGVNESVTIG